MKLLYQKVLINNEDFVSLFFPEYGEGLESEYEDADYYHEFQTKYEERIKQEILKNQNSANDEELDNYHNDILSQYISESGLFELYEIYNEMSFQMLQRQLSAGYIFPVMLSTLKSNCYYSIVYFDYELKFFYYYPKTYFIRKLINITFSVIDSYLISILTEHLGLIFRFNYPEISDEYFQSIVSPNIFTFVSISDIIIRRNSNLTNCVSCFSELIMI